MDLEYKCPISNNKIVYKCYKDKNEAHIEHNNIDINVFKSYFMILRKSIDDLKAKGYKIVVQTVGEYDWHEFLKNDDKWRIREASHIQIVEDNGVNIVKIYTIECNIDDALECISRGLGAFQ